MEADKDKIDDAILAQLNLTLDRAATHIIDNDA